MIIFGQISLFFIGLSNIFLSEFLSKKKILSFSFTSSPIGYGRLVLLKTKVFNILPIVPSLPISFILANLAFLYMLEWLELSNLVA